MTTGLSEAELAAIEARAHNVELPKLAAYGLMDLNSPGVRPPLLHMRVVATVETLNAALDALTERCADGRALVREVRRLAGECERLRGLIRDAARTRGPQVFECPWCQADIDVGEKHFECSAFHEDGRVR